MSHKYIKLMSTSLFELHITLSHIDHKIQVQYAILRYINQIRFRKHIYKLNSQSLLLNSLIREFFTNLAVKI